MDPLEDFEAAAPVRTSGTGSALDRYCPHSPHEKQQAFLALDMKEALYGGAAGGGKSDALLMAALQYVDTPGYHAILFRKTFTELALPEAIMARSHEWLDGTDAHWDGTSKEWRFPCGSSLGFAYLDGPTDHTRYQSAAFQFIGWDELTTFAEQPYRYLFSRLRRLAGMTVPLRMRAATNPGGVGHEWVKQRFSIPDDVDFTRVYSHQGRVFMPASRHENKHLDQDEYTASLEELDTETREHLDKGRWIRDARHLVYADFDPLVNVISLSDVPELPRSESWNRVFSSDFGVGDDTAFGVLQWTRFEPNVYVLESDEWPGLAPSESAEIAEQWRDRYDMFGHWVGDSGGLGKAFQAEWVKRYDLPLEAAEKQNKLAYIKFLNGDLKRRRLLIVRETNAKLIDCLGKLPWADATHQKEHPGFANHLTDMLLYGWRHCYHFTSKIRPAEKTIEQDRNERWSRKAERMQARQQEQDYYRGIGWDG